MTRQKEPIDRAPVRFVVQWYRTVLVVFFGLASLTIVSLLVSSASNPAAVVYFVVTGGALLFVAARSFRVATIEFREDEVRLYGLLRTKRIAWARVRDVSVTRGTSAASLRWRVPCFELDDGSIVRADEIRSLREPSIVDDVVSEARRRLQQ
jgi:hypothetical protein